MTETRAARVRALAKLNLDLRVLTRRADGFHELRSIFQTISLGDTLDISFTPARQTVIEIDDPLQLPENLAVKAARLALDEMRVKGRVELRLRKKIPMGGGLGGGSSDAAAVLLALPVLAGRVLDVSALSRVGSALGSDVPFFLLGGTAAAIGRGTELFPMPDAPRCEGLLVTPEVHVSTAEAYRALSPSLTFELQQNKIFSFQSLAWDGGVSSAAQNDFEAVVFRQHPRIAQVKRKLLRAGASPALMTGSGSAVFGLFPTGEEASRARSALRGEQVFRISLVSRARYRAMWWRALHQHIDQRLWPPRSRYAR